MSKRTVSRPASLVSCIWSLDIPVGGFSLASYYGNLGSLEAQLTNAPKDSCPASLLLITLGVRQDCSSKPDNARSISEIQD